MSVWKRLILASAVTLAITVLLTALPHFRQDMPQRSGDIAVFRLMPIKQLTSGNLVDSMIGLQLSLAIRKVAWNQAALSIDLVVDGRGNENREWAADLQRLLELAFVRTDNVNRVLVRFVEPIPSGGDTARSAARVLAAADVRKTDDWLATELTGLAETDLLSSPEWRQRLRLSVSQEGLIRLGTAD
ncbi:hypothetical protein ACFOLF_05325 [Paenibacillus sepulcri]|uniref:Uncharacterized protein n=1 Tax=Paenibacillus sepulcri TaxID=359917 RepID=A0ABS7CAE3_9BACL|nr:hypothetical protein [Paenibacillus sepulcri]